MDTILICPGDRPAVGFLAQAAPLVAVPILGETLLAYWFASLAGAGTKEVQVLATDRPEFVRSLAGDGSRWGLRVQVHNELTELTREEVEERRQPGSGKAILIDHLPGLENRPLFRSYADWFASILAWMPVAARWNRIGLHEMQPGIWRGCRTHVAASATLVPPVWLGDHVRVGPHAVIGPDAVLEDRVLVDSAAEVCSSVVGPDTFVGGVTRVENSLAWGSTLIDWRTGSCTQVPDPFLLCSLAQRFLPQKARSNGRPLRSRLSALLTTGYTGCFQFLSRDRRQQR